MTYDRRSFNRLLVAAGGVLVLGSAQAQDYPSKPIRLLVPASAGGGADNLARLLGERLSAQLGQTMVVDNKPGANSLIATQEVIKSAPDGHTLLLNFTVLVQNPLLYGKRAAYDPLKDLIALGRVSDALAFFAVPNELGVSDIAGFVAAAKSRPGQINYGTMGSGSTPHLYTVIFAKQAGIEMTHVPYRGEAPMVPDLVAGRLQAGWVSIQSARQLVAGGKAKLLAVSGATRLPALPDVPTFKELGYSNMAADGWAGIFAPAGTPQTIVDRLSTEIERAMSSPELRQKAIAQGVEPRSANTVEFTQMVRRSQQDWGRIVELTGIRLDQ